MLPLVIKISSMKDFMIWDEKYSVGNPDMDDQHKEIINLINLLGKAIDDKKDSKAIVYVLQKMMDYSLFHFSLEEEIMLTANYPSLEKHVKAHESYIKKVNILFKELSQDPVTVPQKTIHFLREWWSSHILQLDSEYGKAIYF